MTLTGEEISHLCEMLKRVDDFKVNKKQYKLMLRIFQFDDDFMYGRMVECQDDIPRKHHISTAELNNPEIVFEIEGTR